jgi:hypothetical protein
VRGALARIWHAAAAALRPLPPFRALRPRNRRPCASGAAPSAPALASLMMTARMRSASMKAAPPPPWRRRVRSATPTPGTTSMLSGVGGVEGVWVGWGWRARGGMKGQGEGAG